MKLERKTIFLYPKTSEIDHELYQTTSQLITRIQKVVVISNRLIEEILCSSCFSSVKCKPTVDMKCVGNNVEDFSDYSNVRICVAKYDNLDYTSNYMKIVDEVKNEKIDISHLIALHIYSNHRPINFYKDENNQFDAVVETDLDHLEHLLTAIMLDISLYHYFSLSSDLKFRRNFNSIKSNYIFNVLKEDDARKTYGETVKSGCPKYLPFSLKWVIELNRRTKKSAKNDTIQTLIQNYGIFLIETIAKNLEVDEYGYISNEELKKEECFRFLEEFLKKERMKTNKIKREVILIISSTVLTDNDTPVMLEYKSKETDITKWLELLKTDIGKYNIILIKRKSKI